MIASLAAAARTIGRTFGARSGGAVITSWAVARPTGNGVTTGTSASQGAITGTIFQEARPTLRSPAPGAMPVGVRRWLLVLEAGTVAIGDVLTGGGYTFTVAAVDAEQIGTWEVTKP